MDTPRSLIRISIPRWLWWAAAVLVLSVLVSLVCGRTYVQRRAAALARLSDCRLQPPGYVPEFLYRGLPIGAFELVEINVFDRKNWLALATFNEVQTVSCRDAHLNDDDLQVLSRLRRLESLEILEERMQVTDTGLSHLAGSPRLKRLTLAQVGISDASFSVIGRLPQLEELRIFGSRVTGSGLAELQHAKRLRSLHLRIDATSSASLDAVGLLGALEHLSLSGSGVTNESLRELALPPTLESLDLSLAELSDTEEGDLVALLVALPGIDRLRFLGLSEHALSRANQERLCERLGMVQRSPGSFTKSP